MNATPWIAGAIAMTASAALGQTATPRLPRAAPVIAWSPKNTTLTPYVAPNRPWWKLADVLALHKGQNSWTQPIVRNADLVADWHQQASGERTPERAYTDNRTGIIVWGGQLRVSIAGQEPFVAGKGYEIDVPIRVPFTLETVGTGPALWFEIHAASDMPIYPVASTPDKPKDANGYTYEKHVLMGGQGEYDAANQPFLDYYKDVVNGTTRAGPFIADQHMFVNNIRGPATVTPPASNLGHFHVGYDEFWFVMEGNIDLQIEGMPVFTASAGDILTAVHGRWHRASFGGPVGQMGTRIAINPYPLGLHNYSVQSGGHQ